MTRWGRKRLVAMLAALAVGLVHAAGQAQALQPQPRPPELITHAEAVDLDHCFMGSLYALQLASAKKNGASLKRAEDFAPDPLVRSLADKVWRDNFDSAWDYGVNFYRTCSATYIDVHSQRFIASEYCLQNGFLTSIADLARQKGVPKEKIYSAYASYLNQPMARKAIDVAYEPHREDGHFFTQTFDGCLELFSTDALSRHP
jgi:hypothetical protein